MKTPFLFLRSIMYCGHARLDFLPPPLPPTGNYKRTLCMTHGQWTTHFSAPKCVCTFKDGPRVCPLRWNNHGKADCLHRLLRVIRFRSIRLEWCSLHMKMQPSDIGQSASGVFRRFFMQLWLARLTVDSTSSSKFSAVYCFLTREGSGQS